MKKVTKAVIAAAGFGTRFLPQTKALPKEMLPLVDKPIIQHIVEELAGAGIEDIVIVTGYHKRAIEDHFDSVSGDLRQNLLDSGKDELLEDTQNISNLANFAYIRQKGLYGNATPLLNAMHLIGDEPFVFAFADDFIEATPSRFKQLIDVYEQRGGSVLACIRARSDDDYKKYAFVNGNEIESGLIQVSAIVEKPGVPSPELSDLASVSGYVLEPALFEYLLKAQKRVKPGEEFRMQESLQQMIKDGHNVYGCEIKNGTYHDTGDKLEYMKTVIEFALRREDLGEELSEYLRQKLL